MKIWKKLSRQARPEALTKKMPPVGVNRNNALCTLTLKMTTAQVVEKSVTVNNNSPIQDYFHPDDQTQPTLECHNFEIITKVLRFTRNKALNKQNKKSLTYDFSHKTEKCCMNNHGLHANFSLKQQWSYWFFQLLVRIYKHTYNFN